MPVTWSIQTAAVPGALGIIQLGASTPEDLEAALARLGIRPVRVATTALRDLCGVDRGVVARWSPTSAHLMPHGGPAVIRALASALIRAGLEEAKAIDPLAVYPEARSKVEAQMLAALARAASPLAVDLLLDQPRRWEGREEAAASPWSAVLNRLIDPPLVVAIGAANIGKSTLANLLAGRTVSIVADEPGTTRDHVGVLVDMAGLVVRYVDTPGIRAAADPVEQEAASLADALAGSADLILACGDATATPPTPGPPGQARMTVATRLDLGTPAWDFDAGVSAADGRGVAELVAAVRERLVPAAALEDPAPWRF